MNQPPQVLHDEGGCSHDDAVHHRGERTCRRCGLVLESSTLALDDFAVGVPLERKSGHYAWQAAVKTVLRRLALPQELAASFARPFEHRSASETYRRLTRATRLETQAAWVVLLRFRHCLSTEEARCACGASAQEWRRAALLFDDEQRPADDTGLLLLREVRRRGLPEQIAACTLRAMEEPRLECCDPFAVLLASAGESIGDALAAQVFETAAAEVELARRKYRVQAFAADLTAAALAMQFCFERCLKERARDAGATDEEERLQAHLPTCSSCAFRAQELGLAFLWRPAGPTSASG